eukprot:c1497_g1_i1 orf=14-169(-)
MTTYSPENFCTPFNLRALKSNHKSTQPSLGRTKSGRLPENSSHALPRSAVT